MNLELLGLGLNGGLVDRYHTVPVLHRQNVGEHTCRLLMVLDALTEGNTHPDLMRIALYHDVAEHVVGDMPYTVKASNPALRALMHREESEVMKKVGFMCEDKLTPGGKALLKFADLGEMALFAIHEMALGNSFHLEVLDNCLSALPQYLEAMPEEMATEKANAAELYKHFEQEYSHYDNHFS